VNAESNTHGGSCSRATVSALLLLLILSGCGGQARVRPGPPRQAQAGPPALRYTIQAAPSKTSTTPCAAPERLSLASWRPIIHRRVGLLHSVRIGNFPSRRSRRPGRGLKAARIIEEYFIIAPGDYAAPGSLHRGIPAPKRNHRTRSVSSACRTSGAGESRLTASTAAALTMAVYQLQRPDLPRTSGEHVVGRKAGRRERTLQGDLVFSPPARQ